jgi:hypothetical protein
MSKSNAFRIDDIISNERVSFYQNQHQQYHARHGFQLNTELINKRQGSFHGENFMHGHNVDLCACVECQTVRFIKLLHYPMLYQYQNMHQASMNNSLLQESTIKREILKQEFKNDKGTY